VTIYLDTSSLIKLFVEEEGSESVRQLIDGADVVATSVVAYPEARAALARLRREGRLTQAKFVSAKRELEEQWPAYLSLELTGELGRAAGDLAERYRLRGYDGVHLASFAEVVRRAGLRDAAFSSFDDRLNRAARSLARALGRSR